MNLIARLAKIRGLRILPEARMLEMYPPFWLMGVKIVESRDRFIHVQLPLRWYGKNLHGTLFGGFCCAVADPLAAILCERYFKGAKVWTKRNAVDFIRPASSDLDVKLILTDRDIQSIEDQLEVDGQATQTFRFAFTDHRGRITAQVQNSVFLTDKTRSS